MDDAREFMHNLAGFGHHQVLIFGDYTKMIKKIAKIMNFNILDVYKRQITDISFKAEKGETVAIIGSTGSGKSTLINLIPRFYDATEGSVKVDGVDVRKMTQKDVRDRRCV